MSQTGRFNLVVDGEGRQHVVPVRLGSVTIGSSPDNTIQLEQQNIAAWQARLERAPNKQVRIVNLDESNKLWVNEEAVTGSRVLHENDVVRVGDFRLALRPGGENPQQGPLLSLRADASETNHASEVSAPSQERLDAVAQAEAKASHAPPSPAMSALSETTDRSMLSGEESHAIDALREITDVQLAPPQQGIVGAKPTQEGTDPEAFPPVEPTVLAPLPDFSDELADSASESAFEPTQLGPPPEPPTKPRTDVTVISTDAAAFIADAPFSAKTTEDSRAHIDREPTDPALPPPAVTRESTDPTLHPPAGMREPTEPMRQPPAGTQEPTDPAVTALSEPTPGTDPLRSPPQGSPEVAAAQEVQQSVRSNPQDVNLPQPERPEGTDKFFVPPAEQPRPEGTDRVFLGVLEGARLVTGEASKRPAQNAGDVAMPRPQAALTGVSTLEGSAWDTALSEPTPPPVVPVVSGDAPAPTAKTPQSTVATGPLNPAGAAGEGSGYEPTMLTNRGLALQNAGGGEANEATMLVHRDAVAGAPPPQPIAREQTPVVQRTDITKRRQRGSTIMWLVAVVVLALCLAGVAFWALKKRQAPVLPTDVVEIPVDEHNLPPRTKQKATP